MNANKVNGNRKLSSDNSINGLTRSYGTSNGINGRNNRNYGVVGSNGGNNGVNGANNRNNGGYRNNTGVNGVNGRNNGRPGISNGSNSSNNVINGRNNGSNGNVENIQESNGSNKYDCPESSDPDKTEQDLKYPTSLYDLVKAIEMNKKKVECPPTVPQKEIICPIRKIKKKCCCCPCIQEPIKPKPIMQFNIPACNGFLDLPLSPVQVADILNLPCTPAEIITPTYNDFLGLEDFKYDLPSDDDNECVKQAFDDLDPCDMMGSANDKLECQCELDKMLDPCAEELEPGNGSKSTGCDLFLEEESGGRNEEWDKYKAYT